MAYLIRMLFTFANFQSATRETLAKNPAAEIEVGKCFQEREDYFECLHSRKDHARMKRVLEEQTKEELAAK
jgi:hypothetical protein